MKTNRLATLALAISLAAIVLALFALTGHGVNIGGPITP